jgi:hypothetical protein
VIADSGKNLRTDGKAGKVLISHWQYKSFINKSNKINKTSPGSPVLTTNFPNVQTFSSYGWKVPK